jgi:hypothetical protein
VAVEIKKQEDFVMNEKYTIDELAMCQTNEQALKACAYHVEAGNIVIGNNYSTALDLIIDELGADFKREIACHIISSNNPSHSKAKAILLESVNANSLRLALQLEKVF